MSIEDIEDGQWQLAKEALEDNLKALSQFPIKHLIEALADREEVEIIERRSPAEGTFVKGPCTVLIIRSS